MRGVTGADSGIIASGGADANGVGVNAGNNAGAGAGAGVFGCVFSWVFSWVFGCDRGLRAALVRAVFFLAMSIVGRNVVKGLVPGKGGSVKGQFFDLLSARCA